MSPNSNMVDSPPALGRRVVAGAGWSLAGRLVVAGLGLVAGAALTRLLPAEQMGTYLLAASFVAFAALVAGAGINQLCVRYVAEHLARGEAGHARRALHVLLRLGMVCAVVGAFAFAGLTDVLGLTVYGGFGLAPLSVLLGAWVFVTAMQALVSDSFRGLADIRAASVYGGPLASVLVVAGLLAVLASRGELTVTGAVLLAVLAAATSAGWGAIALRRRVHRLPARATGDVGRLLTPSVFAVSLPLVLTTALLLVLGSADLWMLGASRPAAEVAAYGIASRTATLVGMPLLVIFGVLPPLIAGLHASGERARLERLLRVTAMAASAPAVVLAAVFAVAGGPLLALVYGEHYRAGALPLAVLSAGQVVSVVTGLCGLVLAMTGHQRLLLGITAASVTATVAALLLVVPVWGTTGAAVVSALGLCGQNIAMLVAARRVTGLFTLAASPGSLRLLRQVLR
jgi:O-antigen/teichoic acid export membrane protein